MNICIVIPTFNLEDKLKKCLNHIINSGYKNLYIIIFDNGSNPPLEKSFFSYKNRVKDLIFIRSSKNLGFAEANNKSLKFGLKFFKKIDYFLLLNNDAYITKDFFYKSLSYLRQNFDLLSPYVFLTKNRGVDSKGINYYPDGTAINRTSNHDGSYLLPAACLFISKKYVKESFDNYNWVFIPFFESYIEDVEFSLRTKLINKKITLIPQKLVYHDRSSTIKDQKRILFLSKRNQLWTIITTWTNTMIKKSIFEIIEDQITSNIIYSLKFKTFFMIPIYIQTILKLPKLLKTRAKIQINVLIDYSGDFFLKKRSLTFAAHIISSKTFKKLSQFLSRLK